MELEKIQEIVNRLSKIFDELEELKKELLKIGAEIK